MKKNEKKVKTKKKGGIGVPALRQVRQLYSPQASDMHFVRDMSFGRDMRFAR